MPTAFSSHHSAVTALAGLPDATLAASASDGQLLIWDAEERELLQYHTDNLAEIGAVAFTPDGNTVVFGNADQLGVLDLETGEIVYHTVGHLGLVNAIAVGPDCRTVISSAGGSEIVVWDIEDAAVIGVYEGHTDTVCGFTFLSHGDRAASVAHDRTIHIWDWQTQITARIISGHTSGELHVASPEDGTTLVTIGGDRTIRFWDDRTGKPLQVIHRTPTDNEAVCVTPDGKFMLSAGSTMLHLWELGTRERIGTRILGCPVTRCAALGSQKFITGDALGRIAFSAIHEMADKPARPPAWDESLEPTPFDPKWPCLSPSAAQSQSVRDEIVRQIAARYGFAPPADYLALGARGVFDPFDLARCLPLSDVRWMSLPEILDYRFEEGAVAGCMPFARDRAAGVWYWLPDRAVAGKTSIIRTAAGVRNTFDSPDIKAFLYRRLLEYCTGYPGELDADEAGDIIPKWLKAFEPEWPKKWTATIQEIAKRPLVSYGNRKSPGQGLLTPEECRQILTRDLHFPEIDREFG